MTFYAYSKETGKIEIAEGSGDNLMKEDIESGYVDYIMMNSTEQTNQKFEADAQVLLKFYFQDYFTNENEVIKYLIETQWLPDVEFSIEIIED